MREDKLIKLEDAEWVIKCLLHQRLIELNKSEIGQDCPSEEEREPWVSGYVAGYTHLLKDIINLVDCGWLDWATDEGT